MFTPKLIVTDLDGTALKNNKDIEDETIAAFENCRKKSIHVAIATARYIGGAAYYANKLHRSEERRVGKECRSRWSPYH